MCRAVTVRTGLITLFQSSFFYKILCDKLGDVDKNCDCSGSKFQLFPLLFIIFYKMVNFEKKPRYDCFDRWDRFRHCAVIPFFNQTQ